MSRSRLALAALYLGANVPFAFKYGARTALGGTLAAVLFGVFAAVVWGLAPRAARALARSDPRGRLFAGAVVLAAVAFGVLLARFDPATIRVTRAPAIEEWLGRLLSGRFPYASSVRPSSFPMIFLLALPFRALGDIGGMQIAGWLAFAILCRRAASPAGAWLAAMLLVASPLFLYEVATRSELFTNMVLIVGVLLLLERPSAGAYNASLRGAAAGLALSTRGIVGLAFAVFFPWRFRREPGTGALTAACCAVAFALTLVPFLLWDAHAFVRQGPFAIQMSYAPAPAIAGAVVLAAVYGAFAGSARRAWLGVALALFAVVGGMFVYSVVIEGWTSVLIEDGFDISYFAFGQTLLIFWMARFGIDAPTAEGSASASIRR